MGSVVILVRLILFLIFFASNFFRLFEFGIRGSKLGFAFGIQSSDSERFCNFVISQAYATLRGKMTLRPILSHAAK